MHKLKNGMMKAPAVMKTAAALMKRLSMLRFSAVLISCKTLALMKTNPPISQGILLLVRWVVVYLMAYVWKLNMLTEEMILAKSISLEKVPPRMDISKLPRIWLTYYGISLYLRGGVPVGISSLLLELA